MCLQVEASAVPHIVRSQGLCPTEKELQTAMSSAGVSGPADIRQVSAVAAALKHTRDASPGHTLRAALAQFDTEQIGVARVTELTHVRVGEGGWCFFCNE